MYTYASVEDFMDKYNASYEVDEDLLETLVLIQLNQNS